MFRVGVLQNGVQGDRLVALEHVAQIAELEVRIGLDQQDADFLLADLDDASLAGCFPSAVSPACGSASTTYSNWPTWVGRYGRRTCCGWPSGPARRLRARWPARRACPSRAARPTPFAPRNRLAVSLHSKLHHVVDEHHVIDHQIGELQIADRAGRCRVPTKIQAARRAAGRTRPRRPARGRRC